MLSAPEQQELAGAALRVLRLAAEPEPVAEPGVAPPPAALVVLPARAVERAPLQAELLASVARAEPFARAALVWAEPTASALAAAHASRWPVWHRL